MYMGNPIISELLQALEAKSKVVSLWVGGGSLLDTVCTATPFHSSTATCNDHPPPHFYDTCSIAALALQLQCLLNWTQSVLHFDFDFALELLANDSDFDFALELFANDFDSVPWLPKKCVDWDLSPNCCGQSCVKI